MSDFSKLPEPDFGTETTFRRRVLSTLMMSMEDEIGYIPNNSNKILSFVVNGSIAYVGTRPEPIKYNFLQYREDKKFLDVVWNEYRTRVLPTHIMQPRIKNALADLVIIRESHDDRHKPYWYTYLEQDLFGFANLLERTPHSVTYVPNGLASLMKEKFIPTLTVSELSDIQGIGKAMKPFAQKT